MERVRHQRCAYRWRFSLHRAWATLVAASVDEPFAWASREFLRKLIIGKVVRFNVEYKIASINRSFGSLTLVDGDVDVAEASVAAGMTKVLESKRGSEVEEARARLKEVEAAAEAQQLGVWSETMAPTADMPIVVRPAESNASPEDILAAAKGQRLPAIVEWVRSGDSMRCYVPKLGASVMIILAGCQCPRLGSPPSSSSSAAAESKDAPEEPKKAEIDQSRPSEPFAAQAKHFVEMRLLHRDVVVQLHGLRARVVRRRLPEVWTTLRETFVRYSLRAVLPSVWIGPFITFL